eukprot:9666273-Prorocentrum_lima.AAC.1
MNAPGKAPMRAPTEKRARSKAIWIPGALAGWKSLRQRPNFRHEFPGLLKPKVEEGRHKPRRAKRKRMRK